MRSGFPAKKTASQSFTALRRNKVKSVFSTTCASEKLFARSVRRFSDEGGSAFELAQCRAIFAKRILRARAVKCWIRNWPAPSRFAAVEVSGFAANFAQAEFISAEHFNYKGSHAVADRAGIAPAQFQVNFSRQIGKGAGFSPLLRFAAKALVPPSPPARTPIV